MKKGRNAALFIYCFSSGKLNGAQRPFPCAEVNRPRSGPA